MKEHFPYILLRLGGLSYNSLHSFVLKEGVFDVFYKKRKALESFEIAINAFLNTKISQSTDYQLKKKLKNIRNDIFNHRNIPFEKYTQSEWLDTITISQLQQLKLLQNEYFQAQQSFQKTFDKHLITTQQQLQTLVSHPNLQNGLVLSAPSLLHRIPKYQQKHPSEFRKKDLQTTRALMQYCSRIALKTSPFSTFNQIASIQLLDENSFFENGQITANKTHLRLNNYLFLYFKNVIIRNLSTRLWLPLRVNSTYQVEDNQHLFLTNFHNVEAFQTVDFNPVIDLIIKKMAHQSLQYGELIQLLLEYIEASETDLQGFVQNLYEIGLLEYDFGISGLQADWHLELIHFLQKIPPSSFTQHILEELFLLKKAIENYTLSNPENRLKLLQTTYKALITLFEKNITAQSTTALFFKKEENTTFQLKTSNLLFEDSSAIIDGGIKATDINKCREQIDVLAEYLDNLEGQSSAYKKVNICFETIFKGQKEVNILTFYQAYAHWKQQQNQFSIIEKCQQKRIQDWQTAFQTHLGKRLSDNSIDITRSDLEAVQSTFLIEKKSTPIKVSAFVQLFKNKKTGQLNGVINAVFPAYGKYFSRFLHLLDEKITLKLREQNAKDETAFHAEIVDNSYFNANIHPPLMPFDIQIPNGNTSLSGPQLLSVSDIFIKKENGQLRLIHEPTKKEVLPYDLGFQSLDGRSELFKLLNVFSPARFVPLHYISDVIMKTFDDEKAVRIIPRITFEKDLVIQRKRWYLVKSILPFSKKNNETSADYYIRLQAWRFKYNLPDEVFYTVAPRNLSGKIDRNQDNHKPQYLDFRNPILVDIFGRNCSKVPVALLIEEFLPNAEMMNKLDGERFVMEFLV